MSFSNKIDKKYREFKATTLALKNKNSVYLIILMVAFFGIYSYKSLPKELFPDVVIPTVLVQTIYPGNPPVDIENLITRPIEKELESIKGLKDLKSTSSQDFSMIFVEFNTNVNIKDALQDVKDAVDKAKPKLPNDMPTDPSVMDIDFSEFPIININIAGDYSIDDLKKFSEKLEDEIETYPEISKVEIKGVNEREIKINIDPHKLDAFTMSFADIEGAINQENISISGGDVLLTDKTRRSIRTIGEFKTVKEIENIVVKHEKGNIVYMRDVADVIDGYEEPKSYARLDNQPVVSLQVIKKGGENLLSATDKIYKLLDEAKERQLIPENINITVTNDQSDMMRKQLSNLENSMIMGVILVVLILFFFLGLRNSLYVGVAIPLSMFLSFLVLDAIGYRINMIVLFSLILALGMLVDNAIVVVENIYRFIDNGYKPFDAAKHAVGEIALPIISSTATTLAAFFPLLFWKDMIGEFMKYLPVTLIIVLTSSLAVALIINPVIAATYSKKGNVEKAPRKKRSLYISGIFLVLAILSYLIKSNSFGSIFLLASILVASYYYFLYKSSLKFQATFLTWLEKKYESVITKSLFKKNPIYILIGTFGLLIFSFVLFGLVKPNVLFFPNNNPSFINVLAEMPIGTDITATDSVMYLIEKDINTLLEPNKKVIKSVLTTVGKGAIGQESIESAGAGDTPNRGMSTISFVDFELRQGVNTSEIMKEISNNLIGKYPGVIITVEKNKMGPPTGAPINIEISGKEFNKLITITDTITYLISSSSIDGIVGLKSDMDAGKPELIVTIDREKTRRFGLSTARVASTIRTALYGNDISDFKDGEDEIPIVLRLKDEYRNNVPSLLNQKISFRDPGTGKIMQIPISALVTINYSTTYSSVKRKNSDRVITLSSNVIEGYNATSINNQLKSILDSYKFPNGYGYKFTGEQQQQGDSMKFLIKALLIAISLIFLILVSQFNSIPKPLIIMTSVLFSTIGVFGGISAFNMDFIVVMTGIGIVSLAGVVVNNAIVLIDYIDLLKKNRKNELGIEEENNLSAEEETKCIINAGKTRLRPVLLTAITTILGLIPMAIGMNIDFIKLLKEFNPNIYWGGDMASFWGPISWTVIFGLTFATFLTLVVVPVMYKITSNLKRKFVKT